MVPVMLDATGSCPRVGARTGAGGVVTVVLVMLGTGATNSGTAEARTGAGGVVTVVLVMLGTGATEGTSSGSTAGARMGAGTSGGAIVTVRLEVPVKAGIETGSGARGSVGSWANYQKYQA